MILQVVLLGHLHLVLATGLLSALFPPCQWAGRFSGLNHYLLFKFLLAEKILSQELTLACVVLCFSSLLRFGYVIGLSKHFPRTHINMTLPYFFASFSHDQPNDDCSIWTFFTGELTVSCLVIFMQIFVLDKSFLCLHHFSAFFALPTFSNLLVLYSFD